MQQQGEDAATQAIAENTLNPISPCGSCMEWLRKIAEGNPDFKVINFVDISCQNVFVRSVPTT